MEQSNEFKWACLLEDAVNKEGMLSTAYRAFHCYSLANQLAAISQCFERDIDISPINTYTSWKKLGRNVIKGSKAISLCRPITRKYKGRNEKTGEEEDKTYQTFAFKKAWFLLSQTEGEKVEVSVSPEFDMAKLLLKLEIVEVDFNHINGNVQGYARAREIAVSPLAVLPHKTRFHEIAHVVLGHTFEHQMTDSEKTKNNIKEVEAECVSYILCSILDLKGLECSRGYIQHWLDTEKIPEKSARKIFSTVDAILTAGQVKAA